MRRTSLLYGMVAALHVACASDGAQPEQPGFEVASQPLAEVAPSAVPESKKASSPAARGRPDLSVTWEMPEGEDVWARDLVARITNTTSRVITAMVVLTAATPSGVFKEHRIPDVAVPPNDDLLLTIPIDDVPAQTEGLATAVRLRVEYLSPSRGEIQTPKRRSTDGIYLTWDTTKPGQALLRSVNEQVKYDSERLRAGDTLRLERVRAMEGDALVEQWPDDNPVGVVLRLGAADGMPAPTLPDSNEGDSPQ